MLFNVNLLPSHQSFIRGVSTHPGLIKEHFTPKIPCNNQSLSCLTMTYLYRNSYHHPNQVHLNQLILSFYLNHLSIWNRHILVHRIVNMWIVIVKKPLLINKSQLSSNHSEISTIGLSLERLTFQ